MGSTARLALLVVVAAAVSGCATYIDRIDTANRLASLGNYEAAAGEMNTILGVSRSDALPATWGGDKPLAALDRGSLQQALTAYEGSARSLSATEQELELLDITSDPVGTLASYLYSDSAKTYRTPPTERLALNPINLLNYLAVNDLDGAAVEARRFQVMREYLDTLNIKAEGPATLGTYLAGFVFEQRGEGDRALRYYEEALAGAGALPSLDEPITRLARSNPYRGPRINEVLVRRRGAKVDTAPPPQLLIVLSLGRVPHRVPARIPIGAAVSIAGAYASGNVDWLSYGAAKVVVYPDLVSTPSNLGPPTVRVDGGTVPVEELTDLGASIRQEYDGAKPKIIAAALTRMAARAAAAEGVRAAGKQQGDALGNVLAVLFEGALVALDRPDTRSWTMMPDRVLVARIPVAPGQHSVDVDFGASGGRTATVEVVSGGYSAVVVTEPR